jgi:hypothetical protein
MPSGVTIEAVLPKLPGGSDGDEGRLVLLPGAAVPGIGVRIVNEHGSRRLIHLDPMTGFPHVESVDRSE